MKLELACRYVCANSTVSKRVYNNGKFKVGLRGAVDGCTNCSLFLCPRVNLQTLIFCICRLLEKKSFIHWVNLWKLHELSRSCNCNHSYCYCFPTIKISQCSQTRTRATKSYFSTFWTGGFSIQRWRVCTLKLLFARIWFTCSRPNYSVV